MLALVVVLALVGWSQTPRADRPQTPSIPTTSSTAAVEAPRSGPSPTASARAQGPSQQVIADLAAIRSVSTPTAPPGTPTIIGEAASQPDLYATEFVRRLLTQDYASPRDSLLAWVNAESAPTSEPLVVGLVPTDLRDRLAIFSVTDTSRSPAPIPTQQEWSALGSKSITQEARIDAVREPLAWLNAVAGGQITDPGLHRTRGRRDGHAAYPFGR